MVWEQTKELLEQPELVLAEYSKRRTAKQTSHVSLAGLRTKKAQEARQQEVEKQRLLDLYQVGTLSLDEIQDRLQGIRAKLKKIDEERTWLEAEANRDHQQLQLIEQLTDFTHKITKRLDQLTFADKKHTLRLLVKEVIVDTATEEMTIHHIVPLDKSSPLRPWSGEPGLPGLVMLSPRL